MHTIVKRSIKLKAEKRKSCYEAMIHTIRSQNFSRSFGDKLTVTRLKLKSLCSLKHDSMRLLEKAAAVFSIGQ